MQILQTLKKQPKYIMTFTSICAFFSMLSFSLITQAYQLEEGKYEVVETGLEYNDMHTMSILGEWLNDHLILLNATQDMPDAKLKNLNRMVLFDIKTKKLSPVLPEKYFYCRNPSSQISRIKDYITGEEKLVVIDENGTISEVKETPAWNKFQCRKYEPRKPDRLQVFLNEGEGYIDIGKTGMGPSGNAMLFLPNKEPIELPVISRTVVSPSHEFLPFMNKYVLAHGLHQNILMSPQGEITYIQEPDDVFNELGVGGYMYPMRDGILLDGTGIGPKIPGMFYIKGGRVIRIFGGKTLFTEPPYTKGELVSPDGCSIAFSSFKRSDYKYKKMIKIINICEGK